MVLEVTKRESLKKTGVCVSAEAYEGVCEKLLRSPWRC